MNEQIIKADEVYDGSQLENIPMQMLLRSRHPYSDVELCRQAVARLKRGRLIRGGEWMKMGSCICNEAIEPITKCL